MSSPIAKSCDISSEKNNEEENSFKIIIIFVFKGGIMKKS